MSYVKTLSLSSTSPAAASTAVGATITGLQDYKSLVVFVTLAGGTGGTLDVYLQISLDQGTTWMDYSHYAQLADGAATIKRMHYTSRYTQQTTIQTVGSGTTATPGVALAANTHIGGDFGDRMRVVYVAGAGTSAGAAQTITILAKS